MNKENSFDAFAENWEEWKNPIIQYICSGIQQYIPKHLKQVLQHLVPDDTGDTICIVLLLL